MQTIKVKQGDAYALPVEITADGEAVSTADIACVEFMLGRLIRHTWPEDVTYADGRFLVPLTQEETFSLREGLELPLDVRVKFVTADVLGATTACLVRVVDAQSTEVL